MKLYRTLALALPLAACVTINIYFPAAAVEKAADRIIDEVWAKKDAGANVAPAAKPAAAPAAPAPQ
jgi:hypothetical protein